MFPETTLVSGHLNGFFLQYVYNTIIYIFNCASMAMWLRLRAHAVVEKG